MTSSKPPKLWLSITLRLLGSMIIPAAGIYFSVKYDDWVWFARSGALLVVQSVAFFALAYVHDSLTEVENFRMEIKPKVEFTDEQRRAFTEGKLKRMEMSLVSYSAAAVTAITGTLIWGFGDLVGVLFQ